MSDILGPGPWPIRGSGCLHCHGELAWRRGVGRVVITHAHGEDQCSFTVAAMSDSDRERARAGLDELERRLVEAAGVRDGQSRPTEVPNVTSKPRVTRETPSALCRPPVWSDGVPTSARQLPRPGRAL